MMDAGIGLAMGQMVAGAMQGSQQPPPPRHTATAAGGADSTTVAGSGQFTAQHIAGLVAQHRDGAHNVWAAGGRWKPWSAVPQIADRAAAAAAGRRRPHPSD